jgi:hypothetical protein
MIRSHWKIDTKVLDGISNYAARFDERAFEIGQRAYEKLADDVLDELQIYPPPPPNSKYVRTYRLRNGWRIGIIPATGGFTIEILNDATDKRGVEYSKYVVGSLAQARTTALKAQAWMHKGRWPLAADTINAWFELFMEEYLAEFQRDLANFGSTSSSRRAFTR